MADTTFKIVFKECDGRTYNDVLKEVSNWYQFNKGKIKILRSAYSSERAKEGKNIVPRRLITIWYSGKSETVNPQNCKHTSTSEIVMQKPTTTMVGSKIHRCTKCGFITKNEVIPVLK